MTQCILIEIKERERERRFFFLWVGVDKMRRGVYLLISHFLLSIAFYTHGKTMWKRRKSLTSPILLHWFPKKYLRARNCHRARQQMLQQQQQQCARRAPSSTSTWLVRRRRRRCCCAEKSYFMAYVCAHRVPSEPQRRQMERPFRMELRRTKRRRRRIYNHRIHLTRLFPCRSARPFT